MDLPFLNKYFVIITTTTFTITIVSLEQKQASQLRFSSAVDWIQHGMETEATTHGRLQQTNKEHLQTQEDQIHLSMRLDSKSPKAML